MLRAVTLLLLLAGLAVPASAAAQTGGDSTDAGADTLRTVLDSVFTAEQAKRGQTEFREFCTSCHVPEYFEGAAFYFMWADQPVSLLFDLMSTQMPMDNPASLSPEQYAAIVAYILSINEYPVGERPLPATADSLRSILIVEPPPPDTSGGG